jgi:hypothetical protein
MNYEVGTTVLAIRDGDSTALNVYGEGVYVGDLPLPGTEDDVPAEDYQQIKTIIEGDDASPVEDHPLVEFAGSMAEKNGRDADEARALCAANITAERARPLDERIAEVYQMINTNPCIYLDSGDIVWGAQCWWGPLDRAKQRFARSKLVLVPVPEGNGRWR